MNAARVALALSAAAAATMFVAAPAFAGQCRDPRIAQAVNEATGRGPNGDDEDGRLAARGAGTHKPIDQDGAGILTNASAN